VITVLFACIHNAGRSQMGAAWFNALSDPAKARALSAGTEPGPRVHPEVLEGMREVGIDLSSVKPSLLTEELASGAALLITMGCGEACPFVPGLRRMDWPLEDPKASLSSAFAPSAMRCERSSLPRAVAPDVELGPATPQDVEMVRRVLVHAALPTEGLLDQFPTAYALARRGIHVVGVAGLERYGAVGLMRSVAVAPATRNCGVGRALLDDRLAAAFGPPSCCRSAHASGAGSSSTTPPATSYSPASTTSSPPPATPR
jgi:arsenate reductase